MDKHDILEIIEKETAKLTPGYCRYAKLAMLELERNDMTSFVLLRNEELRVWWSGEIARIEKRYNRAAQARLEYEIKLSAWNKLTPEDRKVLGLRRPVEPKGMQ